MAKETPTRSIKAAARLLFIESKLTPPEAALSTPVHSQNDMTSKEAVNSALELLQDAASGEKDNSASTEPQDIPPGIALFVAKVAEASLQRKQVAEVVLLGSN